MARAYSIVDAILEINPTAQVQVAANDINKIQWNKGTPVISNEDILAKVAELKTAYEAKEYQRDRKAEYPNHNDCIHALLDGGDTLTDLQAKRTAIKEKYPKE